MLDINCHDCGRVLIGTGRITGLTRTDDGFRIDFVCWCGRPGHEITGRPDRSARRTTTERRRVAPL